jgi:hypothetical protein
MSFELQVELVGLCLFVPDSGAKNLYVLMPAAGTAHGVDPHVVRLCFDSAYLRPGSTRLDGLMTLVPMSRVDLALGAGGSPSLALPRELVNVGTQARRPIDPDALRRDDTARRLTARVSVGSGMYTTYQPGSCWNYPDGSTPPRRLSNRLFWQVGEVEGDELGLTFTPLAGGTGLTLPPLYPIGGSIELAVYHTPREELPPDPVVVPPPPLGTPAHHFAAFYGLFAPPVTDGPLPTFAGIRCSDNDTSLGGSPYTCMAAQSPPEPLPE